MKNDTNEMTISKEEALRKVAEVLEEALAEYEALEKMDLQPAEDPTRPMIQEAASAEAAPEAKEEDSDEEEEEEESEAKDKKEDESKDEEEDEEEEEKSDEALKSEYAAILSTMEQRGLIQKDQSISKSEKAETTGNTGNNGGTDELKKAIDSEIGELKKAIADLSETVSKIAAQPAASRKGVSGLAPLRKSEEGEDKFLRKTEVVEKLLELKKSGDRRVNTALINRVETGRMNSEDLNFIKGMLG